jgi:hypothetical protein
MVFESVPFIYNILSCIFHWIILAGFLVLPTSFPNLQKLAENTGKIDNVFKDARNIPVLVIGLVCCGIGAIGLLILWLRWSHNYLWLLSSIFVPGMFSGLSGVISTFVNLYGAQNSCDGTTDKVHYGATTIATIATTGGCAAICGFLTVVYTIRKFFVVRHHHRENSILHSQDGSVGDSEK